jgi:hypothetical protein
MTENKVFILEIDGRPTLAFDAPNADVAQAVSMDDILRSDLGSMTAEGKALCGTLSTLRSRFALPSEVAVFEHARRRSMPSDDPIMVFLIKVDRIIIVSVDSDV